MTVLKLEITKFPSLSGLSTDRSVILLILSTRQHLLGHPWPSEEVVKSKIHGVGVAHSGVCGSDGAAVSAES